MNIIEPYAIVINIENREHGIGCLRAIEQIARVSHRSEDKMTADSWEKFITSVVINKGDWSIVEHISVSVDALVDRGVTHEWVRHRLGAYTQESTRFVNYTKADKQLQFIVPITFEPGTQQFALWSQAVDTAVFAYNDLIKHGISPQLARNVLPNSLASKIIITYNLRMWRHFFLMRTTKESHPQMKQVTIPLLTEFKTLIPLLFDDITADERQAMNMKKAH